MEILLCLDASQGGKGEAGGDVPLVYTDRDSGNPMRRARAPELFTGGLRQGLPRGDGDGGCPDGLQWDWVGVNPNAEPVQGSLERWLH